MPNLFVRRSANVLALLLVIGICLFDADAQSSKKRRSRRVTRPVVTNPAITPPKDENTAGEEKIVSTADENAEEPEPQAAEVKSKKTKSTSRTSDNAEMQQTINALSNQVERLSDKLNQAQEHDRALLDMERLTRAEQRAENLRSQQVDVETKLADLQSKLEQIEYAIRPENIERATATYGTTRPEEARDARRRQLEGERSRAQAQVKILETSRVRLELAVANADAEVDLLRRRLQTQQQQADAASQQPEVRPTNTRKKP